MLTCVPRAYAKEFKIEIIVLKVVYSTLFNFFKSNFWTFLWKTSNFGFFNLCPKSIRQQDPL